MSAQLCCCSVAFVKCLELYQKLLHIPFYLCHSLSLATICTLSLVTICRDKLEWNKSTWCKVPLKTADKDEWETWKVIVSQSVAEGAGISAVALDLSGLSGWESFSNQREEQRTALSSEHLLCVFQLFFHREVTPVLFSTIITKWFSPRNVIALLWIQYTVNAINFRCKIKMKRIRNLFSKCFLWSLYDYNEPRKCSIEWVL